MFLAPNTLCLHSLEAPSLAMEQDKAQNTPRSSLLSPLTHTPRLSPFPPNFIGLMNVIHRKMKRRRAEGGGRRERAGRLSSYIRSACRRGRERGALRGIFFCRFISKNMNELSVEAFELRAKEAEDRLSLLEKKVASNSSGGTDRQSSSHHPCCISWNCP